MTHKQTEQMVESYQELLAQVQQQLAEYKLALAMDITEWHRQRDINLDQQLLQDVGDIRLEFATIEDGVKNALGHKTISVVYVYPDRLHDFLSQPGLPKELSLLQQGGITLEETSPIIKA